MLSHTTNRFAFAGIRLNGINCAEATLYGAYAGGPGVPLLLLTGDDRMQAQCMENFPAARYAVVKHALGHGAAPAMSPEAARSLIRDIAEQAVHGRDCVPPFRIATPCRLEVELTSVALADLVMAIPVAERLGPCSVAFPAADVATAIGWVNTVSAISAMSR